MSNKAITAVVHDPHCIAIYDAASGTYEGILYITSGAIVGTPIISPTTLSVTYTENGITYMSVYSLPSRTFLKRVTI